MTPLDEEVDVPSDPVVPSDDDETETVTLEDADANDDGEYSEEELTALTKAQLLTLCETLNVEGVTSSNTKAQLIAAILAAQDADNQENLGGG